MSYNWNVYKVFKNGKRAKAPLAAFELDGDEGKADEHFRAVVLENFEEKYRGLQYSILRADLPQTTITPQDENLRKQTQVLRGLIDLSQLNKKDNFSCGLIFAKTTNWKWQWCVLQSGTNLVLQQLSPQFEMHSEAELWMKQQIQDLN